MDADPSGDRGDVLMDSTSPLTSLHLQTLPPFLHPVSPSLAALHMARMRLLCQIPPSAPVLGRWCARCGGLREGKLGGPSKRRRALPIPSKRQIGRTTSLTDLREAGDDMDVDAVGEPDEASGRLEAEAKRKKPMCEHCGSAFTRPKPDRSTLKLFVPARRLRAARKAAIVNDAVASGVDISMPPLSTSPGEVSTTAPALGLSLDGAPPPPPRAPPTLLNTPSLAYIPKEDPNPPSYPQPPPPTGVKRAGSPDGGKSKKRKMKKSGLARLLAESKGREEATKAGGRWGLD